LSETKATVKVEDPLFARKLSTKLKEQKSTLSAIPIPIDTRGTDAERSIYPGIKQLEVRGLILAMVI
jgi:hypothetical protein